MRRNSIATILLIALYAAGCGGTADHTRVMVLGLDGVDPDVVDLLIAEGKLPNFEKLTRDGAHARLYSPPPLLSPIIWTTVATGRKPSDHGIGHFITVDPTSGKELPVTSDMRRVKALWNIFSERDRTVGVVGWWATWPAESVDGVLVSDHAAYHFLMGQKLSEEESTEGVTYPADAIASLEPFLREPEDVTFEELKPFVDIDPAELDREFEFHNDLSHFRWALGAAMTYRDIGLHIWETTTPDLLMVYIEAPDTTSHLFGHLYRQRALAGELAVQQQRYGRAVEQMYVFADEIVGKYIAAMDEHTALVVLSDHGFMLGELPSDPSKTRDMRRVSEAYHTDEGILFLYGAGVRPGVRIEKASVMDIAPSVLALAGLPVAEDMAGRVLDEVIDVPLANPVATYDATGDRDSDPDGGRATGVDSAVLERLESLGYIGATSTTNDRNLANIMLREGRYEEAENSFRKLIETDPEEPVFYAALGGALAGQGRNDEAFAAYARALELDPLLIAALHNRGRLHEVTGDVDAAVEDYRAAIRYDGDYEPSRRALARLGVPVVDRRPETPEEQRAAELLRDAEESIKRGDYDGALSQCNEAQKLTPDVAAVYQCRSNAAYLKGDRGLAEQALERALELEPDNALFRENLRKLREGS
jgi:Flp pilus assembly protein TadD/predicted AlkP superfamily pyrophosphatase or phosphodiesterase